MATHDPEHTIKNPNIDRTTPEKPEAETGVSQPTRGPNGEPEFEPEIDPDRGAPRPEIEDDLSRGSRPDMIPPGSVVDRDGHSEALAADRATARSSDRTDARDGVDGSDSIGRDPDGVGGKALKPLYQRRAAGKAGNPRRV